MKTLIASLLAVGLCTAALPTHAAPKAKPAPTLRVSKAKADGICRDVSSAKRFKKSQRKAAKRKALTRKQSNAVAAEICRFFAADAKSQNRYWQQSLKDLVEQGKLTKEDQKVLGKVLTNPAVIATWKPTTEFGRQLLEYQDGNDYQNDDDVSAQANSGAGWVIGGIIGGIAGGLMTGGNPAGIGAGIAVGGAAGSLAETVFSGDEGDGGSTEEGGDGDGDGGDGGGDGGGEAGGGE